MSPHRFRRWVCWPWLWGSGPASVGSFAQQPASSTMTIRAARVLDGRGKTIANGVVEVQGTKIVAIDQRRGPVTHDLGDVTLMPE